jgi:hypothetical protein
MVGVDTPWNTPSFVAASGPDTAAALVPVAISRQDTAMPNTNLDDQLNGDKFSFNDFAGNIMMFYPSWQELFLLMKCCRVAFTQPPVDAPIISIKVGSFR